MKRFSCLVLSGASAIGLLLFFRGPQAVATPPPFVVVAAQATSLPVVEVAAQASPDLSQRVAQADKLWRATNPSTAYLTAGNAIKYGLEYLAIGKFQESLNYFVDAVRIEPGNPYAQLLLGLANQGAGHQTEAGQALAEAVRLDPALSSLASFDSEQRAALPPVVADNRGGTEAGAVTTAPKPDAAVSADLVYGDYVCTLARWDVGQRRRVYDPKGYFKLNPDGTYRYLDNGQTGRYSYDPSSRQIRWLSGYFAEGGPTTTKYTPNVKVAQIDITFHTPSGDVEWSCGCNR